MPETSPTISRSDSVPMSERSDQGNRSGGANLWSYLIPAVLVLAVILILIRIQASTESAAANLVQLLPIGFALAAGMVASINPCGFLLLPTYISYHLGAQEEGLAEASPARRVGRALSLGGVATLGFVFVAALVGGVISAGGQWLVGVFPYAGLVIGLGMMALGLWLIISGRKLSLLAASRLTISPKGNLRNVFTFGVVYSIGSLSCTLPIFLVVVGSALGTQGLLASFGQFISYALGMGIVLTTVTVGSVLLRGSIVNWLRGAIPYIDRASAMFMVGAGAYLIYYWLFFADAII